MLKPSVVQALAELRGRFGEGNVLHQEDGSGGAYVLVEGLDLGEVYTEETRTSWVGFKIGYDYPMSDIYPHFVRPDLKRSDNRAFGSGVSGPTQYAGYSRDAIQLSRRSNHRDPVTETALRKLLKVLEWVRGGP